MDLKDKIYVAGHSGLVGSAIVRQLKYRGFQNILTISHKNLDLTNQESVQNFLSIEKPDYVILAAGTVGGIRANNSYPADFIYDNLMISVNIIHASYLNDVKRLLHLGSTCIYPKFASQPMPEEALLTGKLEPTNESYAVSKIAGIKLCESYNRQYGTDFRSVMPTNLYGINDDFNPETSHVISGLMRRIHVAKIEKQPHVVVWGTGNVRREFLYVDDMAEASLFVLSLDTKTYLKNTEPTVSHINIGSGVDITIGEMAKIICKVVQYKGELIFDSSMPDGPPQKLIDVSRLAKMGWTYSIALEVGLQNTYRWFKKKYQNL
jgi:GDP-L-fucose synthase